MPRNLDQSERYILGEVAMRGLLDRKGMGLKELKWDDPEIYDEILQEAGDAIASHLNLR